MSLINPLIGSNLVGAGAASFDSTLIGNSVWLDGSADVLTKSFGSGANQQEFVLAAWVQRNLFGSLQFFFGSGASARQFGFGFTASDELELRDFDSPVNARYISNALFRDIGWYHVLASIKTTESTASDRVKIFVNGSEITSFSTETDPSLNFDMNWGISGDTHAIGSYFDGSAKNFFKGYIAQPLYISGKSIQGGDFTISSFLGQFTFGTNGSQFTPKKDSEIAALATGSNSFFLDFSTASVALSSGVTPTSNAGTVSGSLSNLTDGNFTNDWRSNVDPATSVSNAEISFDLSSAKDVKAVKITGRSPITGNFKVQFSDNGSDFTDTGTTFSNVSITTTANSGILDLTSDNPGSHRYWKLINISNSSGTSAWGFREIILDSVAGNLGTDASGNSNDFTLTSMGSANQSSNTPSKAYQTFNPLWKSNNSFTLTDGNTKANLASGGGIIPLTKTIGGNEKVYVEFVATDANNSNFGIGVAKDDIAMNSSFRASGIIGWESDGDRYIDGSQTATNVRSWSDGAVLALALDMENRKLWIRDATGWQGSSGTDNPEDNTTGVSLPSSIGDNAYIVFGNSSGSQDQDAELKTEANSALTYAVPSGFVTLNTADQTAPTHQGIDHFNTVLYTGNGTAIASGGKAVTGTGFQPDWVWIKNRDASDSHALYDVVRGTTKQLEADTAAVESTESEGLTTFGTGFTVGNLAQVNTSSEDYVAWQWLAGGSAVSNTEGSLASSVSVSPAGNFSVGTYSGASGAQTVGHGLSAAPDMLIVKGRNVADSWRVFHTDLGNTRILSLNLSNVGASSSIYWNNDGPTSTTFTVATDASVNGSGNNYVFLAFRSIPGVCKVGLYEGNASSNGTYISMGFKPRLIMVKVVDSGVSSDGNWTIYDTARQSFNSASSNPSLFADDDRDEKSNSHKIDILSDGVKFRDNSNQTNSSRTYLYFAMANIAGGGTAAPIYGR